MDKEYREVAINITSLNPKQIKKLMDLCEKLNVICEIRDEKGNTMPFLIKDMKILMGVE